MNASQVIYCFIVVVAICLISSNASSISFEVPGTNISVHVGEGGSPVRENGPVFKKPEEILGTVVAGSICGPACAVVFNQLSPTDKQKLIGAVSTVGFVVIGASDPLAGLALTLLTTKDDSGGHPVTVHEHQSPPTGKTWSIPVDCIVQRQSGAVLAFTVKECGGSGFLDSGIS